MSYFILLFFSIFISHMAFAGSRYEMNLKINVSEDLLQSHSKENVLKTIESKIVDAEKCINQAFAAGQSQIRLKLNVSSLEWLNQKNVGLLSQAIFQPDRSPEGHLILTHVGSDTQNFTVNFYDVSVNHVPYVFTESSLKIFSSPNMAAFIRSVELGEEPKNINPENGTGNVIPHELMHAIGGIEDNYTDPANTAPNLMGAYGGGNECIFSKKQIELIERNRRWTKSSKR